MNFSLEVKLLAATLVSVAAIIVLALNAGNGYGALADELKHSQVVTVAARNHANADMMHDALRGDVFAALQFARTARERRAEIEAQTGAHAAELRRLVSANAALDVSGDVKAALIGVEEPLRAYTAETLRLVSAAFDGDGEPSLAAFERQFSALEVAMRDVGDKIENLASAYGKSAEAFSRQAEWIRNGSLAFGLFIAIFAIWVTQFDVLSPVAKLTGALQKFARDDYRAVGLPTSRTDELGQMARAIETLGKGASERNRLSRETHTLSELNEWLQSAKTEAELYEMIAEFLSRFLPDCSGSIYIYANSRDVLECAKVWNGSRYVDSMHPDDCWGLRRGRTYTHGTNEIEFDCAHVSAGAAFEYCCIPILAHGETVGLLHLEYAPKDKENIACTKAAFAEQRRLGLAAVEHISLAIANVKLRDQLRDQSIRDVLTGLYNRRYMLETCRREFVRAARVGQPLAVLSIDVDHFKKFNDNHGHDAGDTVLRAVGEVLSATFRGDDVACRFGGEEFVVVLPGSAALVAQQRAEELRALIEALSVRYADSNLPRVTISVGVAAYPVSGNATMEVLKAADDALYLAKQLGRNRVELSPSCRIDAQRPMLAPVALEKPAA